MCVRVRALRALVLPVLLLAAACGGGGGGDGGGGGGGGNPTPTPPPGSSATPRPTASPAPTPTPTSGERAHLVLAEGDAVAGIEVSDIEDASLNDAGAVAVIVTARGANGARAVLLGDTSGEFTAVVTPASPPPAADLTTLARVRLSETGAAIFESGEGIDTDRLYFTSDGAVTPLAGAAPGVVAPDFKILGDVVIGGDGTVGFIGGGDPCTIDTTGPSPRTLCELHLYVARDGALEEVEDDGLVLEKLSPTQPQVAVVDTGVAFFSVPPPSGMPEAPSLLRYGAGELDTILTAGTELPDVGRLVRPQVAAANADEKLFLTTTLTEDEGPSRPTVLGILAGEDFTILDRERTEVGGGNVITDLRAVGIDESGRALYIVRIGEPEDTEAPLTLRLKDATTSVDVATERATLPGTDKTLISVESQRINRRGDVAFIAELGRIDGLTTIVEEVRAVVRLADGRYLAPISTARPGDIGTLSNFEIAGFDDNANLLLIATRAPSQTVLVFAPPIEP
jgi:hypothetical protein